MACGPTRDRARQWINDPMTQWFNDSLIPLQGWSVRGSGHQSSTLLLAWIWQAGRCPGSQGARDPGSQGARATKLQTLGPSALGAVRGTLQKIIHRAFCNWMSKIWGLSKTHERKKRALRAVSKVIQRHPTAGRPVPTKFFFKDQRSQWFNDHRSMTKDSMIQWLNDSMIALGS